MNKPIVVVLLLLSLLFVVACNNSGKQVKVINPNGDSELALLMREMYEDGQRMKKEVMAGKKPEILEKFVAIHTADATEPEKASSPEYKMYADAYLNSLELMRQATTDDLSTSYEAMVQSCMNCHEVLCPGPIVRIKKLQLP